MLTIIYYVLNVLLYGAYYFVAGVSFWLLLKLLWCAVMEFIVNPIREIVEAIILVRQYFTQKTTE